LFKGEKMADDLHLKLFTPSQMTDAERAEFINLVLLGGQVNRHTLPHLIDHAETLVGLYLNEMLVGTAAIKNPHPEHREGDFYKAGVVDQAADYPLELGWIVTHPKHRSKGLARKLVLGRELIKVARA
jgi:hypothetical protein